MLNRSSIKDSYPQPKDKYYLDTPTSGLISKSGVTKAHEFNKRLHQLGSKQAEDFFVNGISEVRKSVARFIDAPTSEIALVPNFSFGLNAILPSIHELKQVLLFRGDYPSLTLPFELNDFEVHWMESVDQFSIDLNAIEDKIKNHKIKILAVSHVQYLTGFKVDIEALRFLCDKYKVLFILDSTQSLGALPFSFRSSGVNICITSNYKWMNAGYGTGIMCIDQETFHRYPPRIGGFNSFKYRNDKWQYLESIRSYEPGHPNMAGLVMLKDAIEFKLKLGLDYISKNNLELLETFTRQLKDIEFDLVGPYSNDLRASIVCIHGNKNLESYLLHHGIIVKMRNGMIRIGIHFYNTEDDIKCLINALQSYQRTITSNH